MLIRILILSIKDVIIALYIICNKRTDYSVKIIKMEIGAKGYNCLGDSKY